MIQELQPSQAQHSKTKQEEKTSVYNASCSISKTHHSIPTIYQGFHSYLD